MSDALLYMFTDSLVSDSITHAFPRRKWSQPGLKDINCTKCIRQDRQMPQHRLQHPTLWTADITRQGPARPIRPQNASLGCPLGSLCLASWGLIANASTFAPFLPEAPETVSYAPCRFSAADQEGDTERLMPKIGTRESGRARAQKGVTETELSLRLGNSSNVNSAPAPGGLKVRAPKYQEPPDNKEPTKDGVQGAAGSVRVNFDTLRVQWTNGNHGEA